MFSIQYAFPTAYFPSLSAIPRPLVRAASASHSSSLHAARLFLWTGGRQAPHSAAGTVRCLQRKTQRPESRVKPPPVRPQAPGRAAYTSYRYRPSARRGRANPRRGARRAGTRPAGGRRGHGRFAGLRSARAQARQGSCHELSHETPTCRS